MTLSTQLAKLEAGGLILLAQLMPEIEYLFRHALIQEAAYQSLVKSQRLGLHRAVGESLEQLYPAGLASPELTPVLARHFAEAGDQPRALHYYTLAARLAAKQYANAEAAHLFSLAIEMGRALPDAAAAMADLFLRRGRALEHSAQDAAAITNYQEMEAWAEARGDRPARLAAMAARATIYVKPTVEQNLPLGRDFHCKPWSWRASWATGAPRPRSSGTCLSTSSPTGTWLRRSNMASARCRWRVSRG